MSRSAPRPKRSADVYARTHFQDSDEPNAKKPRFDARNPSTLAPDAPEDDVVLDLDEIGGGGKTKRNAVNIDGYDSDSENDNFDARARDKVKARTKVEQGEDEDMFADLQESDAEAPEDDGGKPKKKDVRFLDVDEIEGQVSNSKSGGHVSADLHLGAGQVKRKDVDDESSSESGDDDQRDQTGSDVDEEVGAGGKKKNAPKLDAFNMRSEQEDGAFDETGNYVRKAMDPDAVHDTWLEGVSKKEMKKAREAQQLRDEEQRQKDREDDALLTSDLLATLIKHMELGETVLEALQRLGKAKPKSKARPKWQKNKKSNGSANGDDMDVDASAVDKAEARRKEAVEAITGAADQLMTRGDLDVYDHEREVLARSYKRETGDDWVDPRTFEDQDREADLASKQWHYRWADRRDGGGIHGPYDGPTMKAWNEAGYFGEGVEFRESEGDEWLQLVEF